MRSIKSAALILALLRFSTGLVTPFPPENSEQEYCMNEVFRARCAPDEVIVMKTAFYGRMYLTRCITVDMGHLGCSSDVLDLADQRCSGRRECELRMPYPAFEATRPCYDLQSFLKASYYCLKVFTAESQDCARSRQLHLPSPRGRIASLTTFESTWCGTSENPWLIKVPHGQRINITLMDFGLQSGQVRMSALTSLSARRTAGPVRPQRSGLKEAAGQPCRVRYAVLTDRLAASQHVEICGGNGSRERQVYVSASNVVELSIDVRRDNPDYFVLLYEAVGCKNPTLSPGMWQRRDPASHDVIVVGCRSSNERWRLTCVGGEWTGDVIGNCSSGEGRALSNLMRKRERGISMSAGWPTQCHAALIIALVCSLAVIIGSVVAVLALVFVRRRCWHNKSSKSPSVDPQPVSPKSLVSEVEDEMYLRPSNGCHGDGCHGDVGISGINGTSSLPDQTAPDPPREQDRQGDSRQGNDRHGDGRHNSEPSAGAGSRCSECCCCSAAADGCAPRDPAPRDLTTAGPSTLGPPSRTGRLQRAVSAGGSGGPAYRRAASCIEQNKYTHIWQMPLPIPGE